jgi:DNA polymerase-3 subunit gamma/tau
MDVLEIDGASHRGIDDMRQINDTVGYAASSGKYKIYIIDEVHMLTKEAFNALLKTLEEPPEKVMFLFATTEPHKVLPTILSRCQRFNLNRIPSEKITKKLREICSDLNIAIEDRALQLIAEYAEGGLRDAESLLDQISAFHEGTITVTAITDVLGLMPHDALFTIDTAGKEGKLSVAFDIADQLFSQGKNLIHFIETLTEHFRTLLLVKLSGANTPFLNIAQEERPRYELSASLYSQEQCLDILEYLVAMQTEIRFHPSPRIALEAILMHVMRTHQAIPIELLVRRLAEIEKNPGAISVSAPQAPQKPLAMPPAPVVTPPAPPAPVIAPPAPVVIQPQPAPAKVTAPVQALGATTIDPTPSPQDLGKKSAPKAPAPATAPAPIPTPQPPQVHVPFDKNKQSRYDTILQFAAVELEGTIQRQQ